MSRVINFEGRKITVPDDATDDEVAGIIGAPAASPKPPEEGLGSAIGHYVGGIQNGIARIPQGAVELGAKGLDATGLTDHAYDKTHAVFQDMNQIGTPGLKEGNKYVTGGTAVGKVIGGLPVAAATPIAGAGVLPAIGNGILQGGALGALDDPSQPGKSALIGGGIGGALNGVTHGLAALATPVIRASVRALSDNGVTMTPGQILGGWAKGIEDRLAGFPLIGDPIKNAQRQSLRDFGTGAGNIALGGIGPIPQGISGQAMSTTAHHLFDSAYGDILPQMRVTLGGPLTTAVQNAGDTVAARLPDNYNGQFQGTLADVFKKMSAGQAGPANTFPGQAVKDAYSDLGYAARDYGTPTASPNDRGLGRAFGDVQEGLRQSFQSSDPWAAGALGNVDNAYRQFIPVDKAIGAATGNGAGLEAGVFTPRQLRTAVTGADRSVRRTAVSEGGGPLQQYAENGIEVLPSSVPDSGTAGRLGLLEFVNRPHLAIPALATHALYNGPALRAINGAYAGGPSATMLRLADLMRGSAPVGVSAGANATGGRK